MTFLERLDLLMAKHGLNKNTLSKACGIPYTTIDGWYKKGYEGLKLTTLTKLSSYFGVTLDSWLEMDETDYGVKEKAPNAEALELSDVDMQLLSLPEDVKLMVVQLATRLAAGTEVPRVEFDEVTRAQAVQAVQAQEAQLQQHTIGKQDQHSH